MLLHQTDTKSNATTTERDLSGHTVKTADNAPPIITLTYLPCCDAYACIPMLWEMPSAMPIPRKKDS